MNKAIFIDKDGTLVEDIPYNVDPDQLHFTAGAMDALRLLKAQGFLLIVISNQSGIARGYFTEEQLNHLKEALLERLAENGVHVDAFYFCPHHPAGKIPQYAVSCECRKPKPGMILSAAQDFDIDLSHSWMIGDILNDVEAGNKAGCRTVLINNGNETEWRFSRERMPVSIVTNLLQAAQRIIHEPELV